eukprot:gene11286-12467_t
MELVEKFSIFLLFFVLFLTKVSDASLKCSNKTRHAKVGCYKFGNYLGNLLVNDRDPSSIKNQGHLINWDKIEESLHSLICRCSQEVKRLNYKYFGIRFYAECWAGNHIPLDGTQKTNTCFQGQNMATCYDNSTMECAGKNGENYIYTLQPDKSNHINYIDLMGDFLIGLIGRSVMRVVEMACRVEKENATILPQSTVELLVKAILKNTKNVLSSIVQSMEDFLLGQSGLAVLRNVESLVNNPGQDNATTRCPNMEVPDANPKFLPTCFYVNRIRDLLEKYEKLMLKEAEEERERRKSGTCQNCHQNEIKAETTQVTQGQKNAAAINDLDLQSLAIESKEGKVNENNAKDDKTTVDAKSNDVVVVKSKRDGLLSAFKRRKVSCPATENNNQQAITTEDGVSDSTQELQQIVSREGSEQQTKQENCLFNLHFYDLQLSKTSFTLGEKVRCQLDMTCKNCPMKIDVNNIEVQAALCTTGGNSKILPLDKFVIAGGDSLEFSCIASHLGGFIILVEADGKALDIGHHVIDVKKSLWKINVQLSYVNGKFKTCYKLSGLEIKDCQIDLTSDLGKMNDMDGLRGIKNSLIEAFKDGMVLDATRGILKKEVKPQRISEDQDQDTSLRDSPKHILVTDIDAMLANIHNPGMSYSTELSPAIKTKKNQPSKNKASLFDSPEIKILPATPQTDFNVASNPEQDPFACLLAKAQAKRERKNKENQECNVENFAVKSDGRYITGSDENVGSPLLCCLLDEETSVERHVLLAEGDTRKTEASVLDEVEEDAIASSSNDDVRVITDHASNAKDEDLDAKDNDLDAKGNDLDTKGNDLDTKGNDLDVKCNDLDTKGNDLDAKRNDLDAKGSDLDAKGNNRDTKGNDLDTKGSDPDAKGNDLDTKGSDPDAKDNDLDTKGSDLDTDKSLETDKLIDTNCLLEEDEDASFEATLRPKSICNADLQQFNAGDTFEETKIKRKRNDVVRVNTFHFGSKSLASIIDDPSPIRPSLRSTSQLSLSSPVGYSSAKASALIIETDEKKYYHIPPAMARRGNYDKNGTKLHVYNGHIFVAQHFSKSPPSCVVCSLPLTRRIGKQGYQCRDCKIITHKRCHNYVKSHCQGSSFGSLEM